MISLVRIFLLVTPSLPNELHSPVFINHILWKYPGISLHHQRRPLLLILSPISWSPTTDQSFPNSIVLWMSLLNVRCMLGSILKYGKIKRNWNIKIKLKRLWRFMEFSTFQIQDLKEGVVVLRSLCVILKVNLPCQNYQFMFLRILRSAGALSSLEHLDPSRK